MTRTDSPINMAHSVHDRLLALAKERDRPFNELLQYYAMERFLFRLGKSPAGRHFVLKGALLLAARADLPFRPTRDIDLMGKTGNSEDDVRNLLQSACRQFVPDDGIRFDADTMEMERIKRAADYPGVRARFQGFLGRARITMQVDVGFGDVVVPAPETIDYPVLLGMSAPRLRAYPLETAIAEKLHAMVHLGELNSRMKDLLDVWTLCRHAAVKPSGLRKAIQATFAHRKTTVPAEPVCFAPGFAKGKQMQWAAMLRKNPDSPAPRDLKTALEDIWTAIGPIFEDMARTIPASKIPAPSRHG